MDRAIHSRCRIEAMTEVRFFLILFPIKPYVRRNIEKEQKKQSVFSCKKPRSHCTKQSSGWKSGR